MLKNNLTTNQGYKHYHMYMCIQSIKMQQIVKNQTSIFILNKKDATLMLKTWSQPNCVKPIN